MSELTLTIIRLGLLVILWIFVFRVVGVLRGDIYGPRVVSRTPRKPAPATRQPDGRAAAPAKPPKRQPHSSVPHSLVVTQGPLTGTSLPLRQGPARPDLPPRQRLVRGGPRLDQRHLRRHPAADRAGPRRSRQHAADRQDRHRAAALGS